MREIKFRAWDKRKNEWIKYKLGAPPVVDFGGYLLKTMATSYDTVLVGTWNQDSSSYALMQYTGLKDKNDVEIYEGDICKIDWGCWNDCTPEACAEHGYDVKPVKYVDGGFWPCASAGIEGAPEISTYEVIGNIYENPELLEKTS